MKIEKVGIDRIKVTVSASELVKLDIDINTLSPNSKELHSFLFGVMEAVREETGFNPYNGQVVVEATPSQDGISLIVSKMKPLQQKSLKGAIKSSLTVTAKTKHSRQREIIPAIFYFEDFEDMCAALKNITPEQLFVSSLYKIEEIFCFIAGYSQSFNSCMAVMAEFASKRSNYPMQLTYIEEHGTLIAECGDLCNMADAIRNLT